MVTVRDVTLETETPDTDPRAAKIKINDTYGFVAPNWFTKAVYKPF